MGYPTYGSDTFPPLKSGQPLYSEQIIVGPKVSFIQRFHCILGTVLQNSSPWGNRQI